MLELRDGDTPVATYDLDTKKLQLSFDGCEAAGGHCFVRDNIVLTSNPPQYPSTCKHCGATRIGMEQPPMTYSEPRRRE